MLDLKRRHFISLLGGAAAAWPIAARAQQPAMPVIGILDTVGAVTAAAFRQGLAETGYVEGLNVTIEMRATEQYDRLPALATELVRLRVSLIAALGGPSAPAAKAATATIPVVFCIGGDPVELALVASINRPGGNVTGVTFFTARLLEKQIGILHGLIPKATAFGLLVNPNNSRHRSDAEIVQAAARKLGVEIRVASADNEIDLDAVFTDLVRHGTQALVIAGDPFFLRASANLAALAERHAIPAINAAREYAQAGGLLAYGANVADAYRQAGVYAGRILKGEKPADLPVMQPSKFEFVINLKTVRALGLEVPPMLLALADEVIE
jgi:putative ABC transport system substrate-binding protein